MNDALSSAASPVEVLLSALWPVKAYLTEKEIIGKKREKKKREKRTKEEQKTCVLFPCPALLLTKVLVTSRPAPPIVALLGKEATRKKKNE